MRRRQIKVKTPKFKIKEYKDPEYSKFVVVTNPWSKPTPSGHGDHENPEVVKERFANSIGGWFEKMTGERVEGIYFQANKEFIIVELSNSVNVNLILGAHQTEEFFINSSRKDISEIYLYDYLHQGCPKTILKWEYTLPSYDKADLASLRVKDKQDYPPPRKPQSSKPPTYFAQPLLSEAQKLIVSRRARYQEFLQGNSRLPDPPAPTSPGTQISLEKPGPSISVIPTVPSPTSSSFVPYTPPATLAALRSRLQAAADSQPAEPHPDSSRRSVTLYDEHDQNFESRTRHTACGGRHTAEANPEVNFTIKPEPQTHDFHTGSRANAANRYPKVEGSEDCIPAQEGPDQHNSYSFTQPNVEADGDILPKKEEQTEQPMSQEYIRLFHESNAVLQTRRDRFQDKDQIQVLLHTVIGRNDRPSSKDRLDNRTIQTHPQKSSQPSTGISEQRHAPFIKSEDSDSLILKQEPAESHNGNLERDTQHQYKYETRTSTQRNSNARIKVESDFTTVKFQQEFWESPVHPQKPMKDRSPRSHYENRIGREHSAHTAKRERDDGYYGENSFAGVKDGRDLGSPPITTHRAQESSAENRYHDMKRVKRENL